MANELSNKFKFQLASGLIDFDADTFKVMLMASGFVFNKDTHEFLNNVSGSELVNGNGYTTGGLTLSGVAVTEDDTNDRTSVAWSNPAWTASGAGIGPTPGAIIYKSTGIAGTSTVVGYLDFGGNQTAAAGAPFTIQNLEVRLT